MPNYDYETRVPQGGNYKEQAPRKEGFTTYVNGTVDVTTPGEYVITYTHLKPEPFESITESRLVIVSDEGALDDSPEPIVYLYGDSVETIIQGQEFVDPGAYALSRPNALSSDESNLTVKAVSSVEENSWSSQPAGNYSILYYAVSSSKRIGFATRTVIIEAGPTLLELYGCSRLYVEYPEDGTVPIYAGVDYPTSGLHITKDAGYNIKGTDYDLKIFVQRESGGDSYNVSPDNVFFSGDVQSSETYQIYYSVTTSAGVQKLAIREVTMIKPGETDPSILAGLELQKESLNGCADTEPITTEDNEYDDLVDELGDTIDDDPDLTEEEIPEPETNNSLVFLCAGNTAYIGSIFPNTWSSSPGKIPETIVETLFKPANPNGWDLLYKTKTGMILPGDNEQTEWFAEKSSIPWRLYKVHSETKVTYSYGLGAGVVFFRNPSRDVIFSTLEPYYDASGNRIGDIFHGIFGTHIFTEEYGWTINQTKNSSTLRESFDGRHYWGKSASSVTRVTQELKDLHMDVISGENEYTEDGQPLRVLRDPNSRVLNNGIIIPSHTLFYPLQKMVNRQDSGTVAGEDAISLRWFHLAGGRDVSAYCDYYIEPTPDPPSLPLFCNTAIEPGAFTSWSNTTTDYTPEGPIPGCLLEVTWTDNPHKGDHAWAEFRHSNISPDSNYFNAHLENETVWVLKEIYEDKVLYMSLSGEQRYITIDPDDSTMNKFIGMRGTYSWNYWSIAINGGTANGHKLLSNFEPGTRILEDDDSGLFTLNTSLYSGQSYYKSLMAWDRSSTGSGWADPQNNPNKEVTRAEFGANFNHTVNYSVNGTINPCS